MKGPSPGAAAPGTAATTLDRGADALATHEGEQAELDDEPVSSTASARARRAPWHFKLLVVGVTVYMVYRIYWLVEWLPKHI